MARSSNQIENPDGNRGAGLLVLKAEDTLQHNSIHEGEALDNLRMAS